MLPEAHLPPPAIFTARFPATLNAVAIAPGFVRFLSLSLFALRSSFFFLSLPLEHYCIPREREQELAFSSFRVYLVSPARASPLHDCPPFLLSIAVLVAATRATLSSRLFIHSCALGPREGAALKLH